MMNIDEITEKMIEDKLLKMSRSQYIGIYKKCSILKTQLNITWAKATRLVALMDGWFGNEYSAENNLPVYPKQLWEAWERTYGDVPAGLLKVYGVKVFICFDDEPLFSLGDWIINGPYYELPGLKDDYEGIPSCDSWTPNPFKEEA
ncbi:hypothetical protein GF380_03485 [Candidatus Uhrbacteria bacterium]|nr:hypothetical protein [Candidatus Uhrbacteria bacterium]